MSHPIEPIEPFDLSPDPAPPAPHRRPPTLEYQSTPTPRRLAAEQGPEAYFEGSIGRHLYLPVGLCVLGSGATALWVHLFATQLYLPRGPMALTAFAAGCATVSVAAAALVLAILCRFSFGPLGTAAAKWAAIGTLPAAVGLWVGATPLLLFAPFVDLALTGLLFARLFDLDLGESFLATAVAVPLRYFLAFSLFWLL